MCRFYYPVVTPTRTWYRLRVVQNTSWPGPKRKLKSIFKFKNFSQQIIQWTLEQKYKFFFDLPECTHQIQPGSRSQNDQSPSRGSISRCSCGRNSPGLLSNRCCRWQTPRHAWTQAIHHSTDLCSEDLRQCDMFFLREDFKPVFPRGI